MGNTANRFSSLVVVAFSVSACATLAPTIPAESVPPLKINRLAVDCNPDTGVCKLPPQSDDWAPGSCNPATMPKGLLCGEGGAVPAEDAVSPLFDPPLKTGTPGKSTIIGGKERWRYTIVGKSFIRKITMPEVSNYRDNSPRPQVRVKYSPGTAGNWDIPADMSLSDFRNNFARKIANIAGFVELNNSLAVSDPATDAKDKQYRMYSKEVIEFGCDPGGNVVDFQWLKLEEDSDVGVEGPFTPTAPVIISNPFRPEPYIATLALVPGPVSEQKFQWAIRAGPSPLVEYPFTAIQPRRSKEISHTVIGRAYCKDKAGVVDLGVTGTKFPSHRVWVDNVKADEVLQEMLENLWITDPQFGVPMTLHR